MSKRPAGKPYANTRLTAFLDRRILELRPIKTQQEIASEAGFARANVLSMIRSGSIKLPLDRVPGLAKALDCDPKLLFRLAVEQLGNSTTDVAIKEIFGTVVSRNEVAWLEAIRNASDHSDPNLTMRTRSAVRAIFGK